MNIGHEYAATVRENETVFSLSAFQEINRAVERHDLLHKWQHDGLISIAHFGEAGSGSMLQEPRTIAARIVVGDTYIDEPVAQFPSERLIATIALLLQARGEL